MPRLLTEKKAEWARKQKEKERKMEERKAKDNETESQDKGKGRPSGTEKAKEKKNTLSDPGDGHFALDVGQSAKKAEAANKAKLSARGGPIEDPKDKSSGNPVRSRVYRSLLSRARANLGKAANAQGLGRLSNSLNTDGDR